MSAADERRARLAGQCRVAEEHYLAGRYAEALAGWNEALNSYRGLDWAQLAADEREQLLKALFNSGITHGQQGRPEQAIALFADALRRHEHSGLDWAQLAAGEREALLIALVNSGAMHGQQGRPEQAIALFADALRRHEHSGLDWAQLAAGERKLLLKSLVNGGVMHRVQGRPEQEIALYADALRRHEHSGLDWAQLAAGEREQLLEALVNSGVTHREQGRPEQAIALYADALRRHEHSGLDWAQLSAGEREALLRALVNSCVTHGQQGRPEQAIALFADALRRHDHSGLDWAQLAAGERKLLLQALVNSGIMHGQQGRPEQAIALYADALRRHEHSGLAWAQLAVGERKQLLRALVNSGDTHGRQGRPEQALALFADALRRHEHSGLDWAQLTAGERGALLHALVNSGITHGQQGRPEQAIALYADALHRHEHSGLDWAQLAAGEREGLAKACWNLFAHRSQTRFNALRLLKMLDGDALAALPISHREWQAVPRRATVLPASAEHWLLTEGRHLGQCRQPAQQQLALAFLLRQILRRRRLAQRLQRGPFAELARLSADLTRRRATPPPTEARRRHWWQRGWLAARPRQPAPMPPVPAVDRLRRLCAQCAQALLDAQSEDLPTLSGDALWLAGAYWAAPDSFAFAAAAAAGEAPTASPAAPAALPLWQRSDDELARGLQLAALRLSDTDGSLHWRRADWWLDRLCGGARDGEALPAVDDTEWRAPLDAWAAGDSGPLRAALAGAARRLANAARQLAAVPTPRDAGTRDDAEPLARLLRAMNAAAEDEAPSSPAPSPVPAGHWAALRLPVYRAPASDPSAASPPDRVTAAWQALAGGMPRRAVRQALADDLFAPLAALYAAEQLDETALAAALRALPSRVWRALGSPRLSTGLQRLLLRQTQVQLTAAGDDSAALWLLLETGRLALAALRLPAALPELDAPAWQRLQASVDAEWSRVDAALAARERGATLPGGAGRAAYPPFDRLAAEYRRLGWRLPLPERAAAAARLAADEALLQIYFDADGGAQALCLTADGRLWRQPLPAAAGAAAWAPLHAAWSAFYASGQASDPAWLAAFDTAWRLLLAPDGPAATLLAAIVRATPSARRWTLLLPAALARLPWLAWPLADAADSAALPAALRVPGALRLEACLSAWSPLPSEPAAAGTPDEAPDEASDEAPDDGLPPAAPRVLMESWHGGGAPEWRQSEAASSAPEWLATPAAVAAALAAAEARTVAAHLGSSVLASAEAGIDDALRMLQATAPVHWVLHGEYRAHDPLASFVVLGDRRPRELPAWLLEVSDCRAPVSLSSCYALLVGGEDAQSLLGPVGFGPLLRARGAPWVIGPLWQSNMLASALFYDVFHAECRAHGPQAALERATRHLRTLGYRQLADWAQAQGGALPVIVAHWSEYMRAQGHALPFAHPAYWAQFSLLGPR